MSILSQLSFADWLSVVAVLVGLPAATYYPFMFLRIKFWESDIGKSMFLKGLALALVFWTAIGTIAAAVWAWGWYEWVHTSTNWLLAIAVWVQVLVMRHVQRDGELQQRMGRRVVQDERTDS